MKNIFIALILLICFNNSLAQSNKSINVSKEKIFDVLPLKFNKKADSLSVRKYLRDSILPRAIALGYIPIASIPVNKNVSIQGNYMPDVVVFGAWKNQESLHTAMEKLEVEFKDFHALRREIWTVFYNTHYKLKNDLNFTFLPNKFYIATAYWKNKSADFDKLIAETKNNVDKQKGKIILELSNGNSPYAYYYNPDYFYITEWSNENEFKEFMKVNKPLEKQQLKHINQFDLKVK